MPSPAQELSGLHYSLATATGRAIILAWWHGKSWATRQDSVVSSPAAWISPSQPGAVEEDNNNGSSSRSSSRSSSSSSSVGDGGWHRNLSVSPGSYERLRYDDTSTGSTGNIATDRPSYAVSEDNSHLCGEERPDSADEGSPWLQGQQERAASGGDWLRELCTRSRAGSLETNRVAHLDTHSATLHP
ncbi:hypothetical protein CSOJ01_08282 [Colletotrichum sojae]|uniref:Uncharacterized protein n=1 Tax=Colletotrichum sojae TaxID=2175907 RepID=A0A8H6J6Q0_9PEZI|nr:hypothetical protein CSOJ01_08282 [Colletotrichum sojae]